MSGPSLLEVRCHKNLDGALQVMACMHPIALTRPRSIDKCCSATHQLRSRLSQMMMHKYSKMQHIFAYNGHSRELPPHDSHFLESSRVADVKL